MKPIAFVGDALDEMRGFPATARREAGYQLDRVQRGLDPEDWRSMASVGSGVREIRVRDDAGAFRVIYVASLADAIYVPHAFGKKTQRTAKRDLDLAASRLRQVSRDGMSDEPVQVFARVWDALEETPEEAAAMRLRSDLAAAVGAAVEGWGLPRAEAARRLGVTRPRLDDLLRGRVARFGLDALVGLAERAGLEVRMEVARAA